MAASIAGVTGSAGLAGTDSDGPCGILDSPGVSSAALVSVSLIEGVVLFPERAEGTGGASQGQGGTGIYALLAVFCGDMATADMMTIACASGKSSVIVRSMTAS